MSYQKDHPGRHFTCRLTGKHSSYIQHITLSQHERLFPPHQYAAVQEDTAMKSCSSADCKFKGTMTGKTKRLVSQILNGIYERPEAFCYIDTQYHLQLATKAWQSISSCCKIMLDQEQRSKLEIRWMRHIKCGCQSKTNKQKYKTNTCKGTQQKKQQEHILKWYWILPTLS